MKITSIALPADLAQKIDVAARRDERSRSQYIRRILEREVGEVTGASRLADLERIAAQYLPQSNDRSNEVNPLKDRKEGTPLETTLPHNVGNPVRDIYSPPHRPVVVGVNDSVNMKTPRRSEK